MPTLIHLVCALRYLPTVDMLSKYCQALFILYLRCTRADVVRKVYFLCAGECAVWLILHCISGLIACAVLAGGRSLAVLVDGSCCSSFSDWSI